MSKTIEKIKLQIEKCVGADCVIMSKQGRKNVVFENCVIAKAYPDIFLVTHTQKNSKTNCLTFSYAEVLTKKVLLCKPQKKSDEKGA